MFSVRTMVVATGASFMAAAAAVLLYKKLRRDKQHEKKAASSIVSQQCELPQTSVAQKKPASIGNQKPLDVFVNDDANTTSVLSAGSAFTGSSVTNGAGTDTSLDKDGVASSSLQEQAAVSLPDVSVKALPPMCTTKESRPSESAIGRSPNGSPPGLQEAIEKDDSESTERFSLPATANLEKHKQLSVATTDTSVSSDFSVPELQLAAESKTTVLLSNITTSTRVFVQLPNNSSFLSLKELTYDMTIFYSGAAASDIPPLLEDIDSSFLSAVGCLCAYQSDGVWFRGEIVGPRIQLRHSDDNEIANFMVLRDVDYGGYNTVPFTNIRQIRSQFLGLPLQAVECVMAHGTLPQNSHEESIAVAALSSYAGSQLECTVVGVDLRTGLPLIELHANVDGAVIYLNQLTSERGNTEMTSGGGS